MKSSVSVKPQSRSQWLDGAEPIQPPVVKQALSEGGVFVVVTLLPTDSGVATGAAVGVGAVVYVSPLLLVSGDFRALVTSMLPVELPSP